MSHEDKDIAVIGIACRFPDADSGDAFFRNLLAGKDSVTEIPRQRWDHGDLPDGHARLNSRWGGFISGVDEFDARFFKILPAEADLMDPQQKLFLTCSWESLEDAGYARRGATAGRPVGVFAGVTWSEFSLIANEYGYLCGEHAKANPMYWSIPNRVSYFFDFSGPSLAIDTACSSSLAAIHLAAQSLRQGECEMALAGGVNLSLHPAKYLFLSNSGFLSTEGKCRGFGDGGDGYVPSEGVGVLVLKRLSAAEADGDRIYGVIKATAVNHGGRATGYTVPNPRAHQAVIEAALRQARVSPRDISYVECHGTGTDLGDPIEVAGLRMAFEAGSGDRQYCGIGTVKSNIGHCEAAAGVAGLIKILHGMQAGTIPATLHAEVPNRKIDFVGSPFYLVRQNAAWKQNQGPLTAGLSSFGAGGSNSHCIVQSHAPQQSAQPAACDRAQVIAVSSLHRDRTLAYCRALRRFLSDSSVSIADVATTLRRREEFPHRVAFVVASVAELAELLARYDESGAKDNLLVAHGPDDVRQAGTADAARRWIDGEILLSELPPAGGRPIGLPTYQFEPARSWLHDSKYLYRRRPGPGQVLHPLVDASAATAARGIYVKTLHCDEFFVEEHWVEGQPVLPGVCLVEMASFCGSTYLETKGLELNDIWFLEPVALRDAAAVRLEVEISGAGDERHFDVYSRERSVKHAAGKMRRTTPAALAPAAVDLQAVLSRCPDVMTPAEVYERFGRSGIVQKGRFQVVNEFRWGPSQALARLTLSEKLAAEARYGMNPTLLDGAVQTAMVHLFRQIPETGTVLPFQIGSCIRYGALPAKVVVVATLKSLAGQKYDIKLCDESGVVVAEISDFVLREYHGRHQMARPLLFGVVPRPLAPLHAGLRKDDGGFPCVLWSGRSSLLPTADLPAQWTRIPWDTEAGWDLALGEWLAASREDGLARIAVLLDDGRQAKTMADFYDVAEANAYRLFRFAKVLAGSDRRADVIVCIRGDREGGGALAQAGLGFLKCLNQEFNRCRFRLIEMDPEVDGSEVPGLLAAEFAAGGDAYVRYRQGDRWTEGIEPLPEGDGEKCQTAEPDAWIVTGAGGRLGMLASRHLLEQGKRVLMIGRRPLDEASTRSLASYPADRWRYLPCDLTERDQVAATAKAAAEAFGSSWGIVHCAGKIDDGAILGKEWPSFQDVVRAKVKSLVLLCEGLSAAQVKRIVLFSSLTSLLGNRGQSDYGYANGFLDGFAAVARSELPGQPAVTVVHWPYWLDGGMKIETKHLAAYQSANLTQPLPTEVGMRLLDRLLADRGVRAGVVYTDAPLDQVKSKLELKALPAAKPAGSAPRSDMAEPADGRPAIQRYVLHLLESAMGLQLTEDDIELQFSELGVDSIAQMDLISKLEKEERFDDIPQTLLLDNTTVASLVEFFHENYRHADYRVH